MTDWPQTRIDGGFVTTYGAVRGRDRTDVERRLGFNPKRLDAGYAIYALSQPILKSEFGWRDTTAYSGGVEADPDARFLGVQYLVPRQDIVRFRDALKRGYASSTKVDDLSRIATENDKAMERMLDHAFRGINKRDGDDRIIKVVPKTTIGNYPNSDYSSIPQWEIIEKTKSFTLLEVIPGIPAANLSGSAWWHANQANYPNSAAIADLDPGFRTKVETFLAALAKANANVSVAATRRNKNRAWLMHWSFKLSKGQVKAKDIKANPEVDIDWVHADEKASRKAAKEMVDLFQIVYQPSLTSLHIRGLAIDMNISWAGTLIIVDGKGKTREIGTPLTGSANTDLHAVGATYGVHKLLSDKPHWSSNGH